MIGSGRWGLGKKALCHFWNMGIEVLSVTLQVHSFPVLADLMWHCQGIGQSDPDLPRGRQCRCPPASCIPTACDRTQKQKVNLGSLMRSGSEFAFVAWPSLNNTLRCGHRLYCQICSPSPTAWRDEVPSEGSFQCPEMPSSKGNCPAIS